MSALDQKQTFALQNGMSALPPIATAKADSRKRSCPLYPQKQTCALQLEMSALGHKRTSPASFDHLIGTADERVGDGDAERLGGLEVDVHLDLCCLLDR